MLPRYTIIIFANNDQLTEKCINKQKRYYKQKKLASKIKFSMHKQDYLNRMVEKTPFYSTSETKILYINL